jgi:hypothetical protein
MKDETQFGTCIVCCARVAKKLLYRGRCVDCAFDGDEGTGCAECSHPTSHFRDCERVA